MCSPLVRRRADLLAAENAGEEKEQDQRRGHASGAVQVQRIAGEHIHSCLDLRLQAGSVVSVLPSTSQRQMQSIQLCTSIG